MDGTAMTMSDINDPISMARHGDLKVLFVERMGA